MMSMLAPPSLVERIDRDKCIKMCLVHDMAESLVGDITPVDGVPRKEKHAREASTIDFMTKRLLGNVDGRGSWQGDARYMGRVREVRDAREPLCSRHRQDGAPAPGRSNTRNVAKVRWISASSPTWRRKLVLPETKVWAAELLKEREAFWGSRNHVHGDEGVGGGVPSTHVEMQEEYYDEESKGE